MHHFYSQTRTNKYTQKDDALRREKKAEVVFTRGHNFCEKEKEK